MPGLPAVPTRPQPGWHRTMTICGGLAFAAGLAMAWAETRVDAGPARAPAAAAQSPAGSAQAPAALAATRVYIPALNRQAGASLCTSTLSVQALGPAPSRAVLLLWEQLDAEDPNCLAPSQLICSGLLRPGSSWDFHFDEKQVETATSGVIYSITTARFSEIGVAVAGDPLVADYVCDALAAALGDCAAYASFAQEFASGGELGELPLDRAVGGALAAQVQRRCPGGTSASILATSAYAGVGSHALGSPDLAEGGSYRYHAAPLVRDESGVASTLFVQNAGAEPAFVTLWLEAEGACDGGELCRTLELDPGASARVPVSSCVADGWQGNARLISGQPLAVAVDNAGLDASASFTALAMGADTDALGMPLGAEARFAASGALALSPHHGWETVVTVQNLSPTASGEVAVTLRDAGGGEIAVRQGLVCAGSSRSFEVLAREDHPGARFASIEVESLAGAGGPVDRLPIGAVATLRGWETLDDSPADQVLAYPLAPGAAGPRDPAVDQAAAGAGTALLALPSVWKDLDDEPYVTSEIAVTNHVRLPGWTDFAVLLFDQNDLVDVVCRRLGAGQSLLVDPQTFGALPPGFRGSAIVSATYWEHPIPVSGARPAGHQVGLGAVAVTHTRTRFGEDIPGDEAAATEGIPLATWPDGVARPGNPCGTRRLTGAPPDPLGHWQSLVPVYADRAGYDSHFMIRNLGEAPTELRLRFQVSGDCLRERICSVPALAPGETIRVPASQCVGPDWYGSVVLHSREPLELGMETVGRDPVLRAAGRPGRLAYDLNADGRVDDGDRLALLAAHGSVPGASNWNALADLDASGKVDDGDLAQLRMHLCGADLSPGDPEPEPPSLAGLAAWLPALGFAEGVDLCAATVSAQNLSDAPARPLLVTWGDPSAGGACAGPTAVVCGGILPPGSAWEFPFGTIGAGAASGAVYSFNLRPLSELGAAVGGDEPAADYLCRTLPGLLVGDCDAFARFNAAYAAGTDFAGVPLGRAAAGGVAAEVTRLCPGDASPGSLVSAGYAALGTRDLGTEDRALGGYLMYAPFAIHRVGFHSEFHVQNAGAAAAEVELWYRWQDDCSRAAICRSFRLEPGEARSVSASECGGPDSGGNAWVQSEQPLALTVDVAGHDSQFTYRGIAPLLTSDAAGAALPAGGRTTAFGPLFLDPGHGWDAGVQVQNLGRNRPALVNVSFLDAEGTPLAVYDDYICPAGSQTYFLPVSDARPGLGIGSLRVVSQSVLRDGGAAPAPIAAMALMMQYSDPARSALIASGAYTLRSEREALARLPGSASRAPGGGADPALTGVPAVALPGLVKAVGTPLQTSQLAIANFVPAPGTTQFAVLLRDANGLVEVLCHTLDAGKVLHLDLATLAGVPAGFRGAAIVSATHWTHEVWGPGDGPPQRLVGLGAVAIRGGGGPDRPGDEIGLSEGLPLASVPAALVAGAAGPCLGPVQPTPTPTPGPGERAPVLLPWLVRSW